MTNCDLDGDKKIFFVPSNSFKKLQSKQLLLDVRFYTLEYSFEDFYK